MSGVARSERVISIRNANEVEPASVVVPYQYTMIVWAALFGYLVFGDVPSTNIIVGAAVIAAAGLYIFIRERNLGATASPPSMPPA